MKRIKLTPGRERLFFAMTTGLMLTASFPRPGWEWLVWAAFVPLFLALRGASQGQAFRLGFSAGLVHYALLVYWLVHTMRTFGSLPLAAALPLLILLSAYLALYPGLFSVIIVRYLKKPAAFFIIAPILWVGLEYIRSFFLTGFPWELLGYSLFQRLHLIQISDITGVYGLSYLILLVNGTLFFLLLYARGKREPDDRWRGEITGKTAIITLAAAFISVGAVWVYGGIRLKQVDGEIRNAPSVRVAAIQGNIDQTIKWDPAFQESSTRKYIKLSHSVQAENPRLIVWPETAAPFYFLHNRNMTRMVEWGVRRAGTHFIIGSPSFEKYGKDVRLFNSAYLVDPEGKAVSRYDKVHLVPFGEYVPMQKWLPFVNKLVAQVGDFRTGEKGELLMMEDIRLGILVCYEIIFPELSAAAAGNGADLLINITNDAWYGRSSAPYQHFSMAVFRAVENRRSLARAANTGISGFIDPAGRIRETTELFTEAAAVTDLPLLRISSFYSRRGDLFARICLGLAFLGLICLRLLPGGHMDLWIQEEKK